MTDRRIRTSASILLALTVGAMAWLLLRDNDSPREESAQPSDVPRLVSKGELVSFAAAEGPVFWAGQEGGDTLELTHRPDGAIFVRYLRARSEVGANSARRTVATYPLDDALAAIRRSAREPGARLLKLADAGRAVVNSKRPTNVYLAYPDLAVQIEVFDPEPGRAEELVRTGRVVPVESR